MVIFNSYVGHYQEGNSYGTQPLVAKIRKGGSQGLAQLEVRVFGGAVAHFWHVGASVLAAAAAMVWQLPPNPLEVDSHTVYIQLARKRVLHGHSGIH